MFNFFNQLPDWSKFLCVAVVSGFFGATGKDIFMNNIINQPDIDASIMVRSEKTGKPLEDVDAKYFVGSDAPISAKTDNNGYAKIEVASKSNVRVEISKLGYVAKKETLNLDQKTNQRELFLSIDQKAPFCYGDSCTQRIPGAAQCNGDVNNLNYATGKKFTNTLGQDNFLRIELRHSTKCNSVWAKSVSPVGAKVYLQDDTGSKFNEFKVPKDDLPDHHSEMVSGDLRVRACVQFSSEDKEPLCTGFIQ
jgi:hypothetical protein